MSSTVGLKKQLSFPCPPLGGTAASEAGKIHIQHPYNQHWSSSGLRSLPSALLSLPQMTVHLKTPPSRSWSLQTTPHWSASFRMVTSLLTDRRLRSWLSGAVLTTWSPTRSKHDRGLQDKPLCSPPTHHHEQPCDCSGVIQIPGHHHLPGPEMGQSHWLHCEKGPAEIVLPSPAEEVQPVTGAAETVLLCHPSLNPSSESVLQHLRFSQKMEELVYAGTKLSASPQISTKKTAGPPTTKDCRLSSPASSCESSPTAATTPGPKPSSICCRWTKNNW